MGSTFSPPIRLLSNENSSTSNMILAERLTGRRYSLDSQRNLNRKHTIRRALHRPPLFLTLSPIRRISHSQDTGPICIISRKIGYCNLTSQTKSNEHLQTKNNNSIPFHIQHTPIELLYKTPIIISLKKQPKSLLDNYAQQSIAHPSLLALLSIFRDYPYPKKRNALIKKQTRNWIASPWPPKPGGRRRSYRSDHRLCRRIGTLLFQLAI
jgi:hypothetical protein